MQTTILMSAVLLLGVSLTACTTKGALDYGSEPTTSNYTEPYVSGLRAGKPYPSAEDVCQTIEPNKATRELDKAGFFLIGCPKHERGAIADRVAEGASVVAQSRHWTLLQLPDQASL